MLQKTKCNIICNIFQNGNNHKGGQMDIELKDEERQPCECWTRVMGYFRPSSQFNLGKKSEFNERKYFLEKKAMRQLTFEQGRLLPEAQGFPRVSPKMA